MQDLTFGVDSCKFSCSLLPYGTIIHKRLLDLLNRGSIQQNGLQIDADACDGIQLYEYYMNNR